MAELREHNEQNLDSAVAGALRLSGIEGRMLGMQDRIRAVREGCGVPDLDVGHATAPALSHCGAEPASQVPWAMSSVLPARPTPYLDELLYAREALAWDEVSEGAYAAGEPAGSGVAYGDGTLSGYDVSVWPGPSAATGATMPSGMPLSFDLAPAAPSPSPAAPFVPEPFEPEPAPVMALSVPDRGFFDEPPTPIDESMHRVDVERALSRRSKVILAAFALVIVGAVGLGVYAINGIAEQEGAGGPGSSAVDEQGGADEQGDAQGGVPSGEQGDLEDLTGGDDPAAADPGDSPVTDPEDPSGEGSSVTDPFAGQVAETVTYTYVTDRYGEEGVAAREEVSFGSDGLCLVTRLSAEFSSPAAAATFCDTMEASYGTRCLSAEVDGKTATVVVDISSMARDKDGYEAALRNTVEALTVLDPDPAVEDLMPSRAITQELLSDPAADVASA